MTLSNSIRAPMRHVYVATSFPRVAEGVREIAEAVDAPGLGVAGSIGSETNYRRQAVALHTLLSRSIVALIALTLNLGGVRSRFVGEASSNAKKRLQLSRHLSKRARISTSLMVLTTAAKCWSKLMKALQPCAFARWSASAKSIPRRIQSNAFAARQGPPM